MTRALLSLLDGETKKLEQAGLYKREVVFSASGQATDVGTGRGGIHYTAHDYLGLARDERIAQAAIEAMERHGFGASAARAFSGTRKIHKQLEKALATFLKLPDSIVYGSGYLANVGLFQTLFDSRDLIFCDALIHPSLADGIRLCSAQPFAYHSNDTEDLEDKLKRSRSARFRVIVTDGVCPVNGEVAALDEICKLADKYDALVIIDDSLGVGVLGAHGRGARELRRVMKRVDVVTGTFSTVLGGGAGGYVAGRQEIVDWLRQKSGPYLFSGSLPPAMAGAARQALELVKSGHNEIETLRRRVEAMWTGLTEVGFQVLGREHPILAVPVGNVVTLQKMINQLLDLGIYVNGLCYPVVAEGEARVQLHVSALHSEKDVHKTIEAFQKAGTAQRVI